MVTPLHLFCIIAFFLYSLYGIYYPDGTFNFLFEYRTKEDDWTKSLTVESTGNVSVSCLRHPTTLFTTFSVFVVGNKWMSVTVEGQQYSRIPYFIMSDLQKEVRTRLVSENGGEIPLFYTSCLLTILPSESTLRLIKPDETVCKYSELMYLLHNVDDTVVEKWWEDLISENVSNEDVSNEDVFNEDVFNKDVLD
jgi:hypothetical protein